MADKERIKREIETLNLLLEHYRFEQNHLLSDFTPRMSIVFGLGIALTATFISLGFGVTSVVFIFLSLFEVGRYAFDLNKKRNNICKKTLRLRTKILSKYQELGVDTKRLLIEFS